MANEFFQIHALAERPFGKVRIGVLAFPLHMQLQRNAFLGGEVHGFIQQFIGKVPDFIGHRPVGSSNFPDSVSVPFVNQRKGGLDAVAVILNRSLFAGCALITDPSLKLVSKGRWVRAKHHTNAQADLISNRLRHGDGVPVGRFMTGQRFRGRGEIWAMNQHNVGSTNPLECTSRIQKQPSAVEVEMVVQNRTVVDHVSPSNSLHEPSLVGEHALPVNGGHCDHVGVSSVGDDALSVGPNLNGQTVSRIGQRGASQAGIVFG